MATLTGAVNLFIQKYGGPQTVGPGTENKQKEGTMKRVTLTLIIGLIFAPMCLAQIDVKDMTPKIPMFKFDLTVGTSYGFIFQTNTLPELRVSKQDLIEMINDHLKKVQAKHKEAYQKQQADLKLLKEAKEKAKEEKTLGPIEKK